MTADIQRIFDAVVALPPDQRAAALQALCQGNAPLRAEVETLLRSHDAVAGFLGHPTADVPTAAAKGPEGPGARIGPYKLLELIGEGGFGSVFMAEQNQPVHRKVALKVIKPGMDSRMVAARFEAERQALALMDHPHIARVFDGGVTDAALGSRPYFVMEYVKGDPITAFADGHKLSLKDRLALFTQVCLAVQHAHTKGIIHRDLKPSNVLVSMTDGKPFAKVIDFGIAKATGQRLTDKTLFTEHRQLIGTPEYMSPEQSQGSPDIDTRTDVYALGVLLYELLTGVTPFDAQRLRSAAFDEMQRIIREEEPPTPSVRVTRKLERKVPVTNEPRALASGGSPAQTEATTKGNPLAGARGSLTPGDLKGELDWIVMKAIDKDRARRYESASQLAQDVERHLAGEAIVAAPPSRMYLVRKFVKKHKGPVTAGVWLAWAIVVGTAGTSWGLIQAMKANSRLQQEIRRAHLAEADSILFRSAYVSEEPSAHQPSIREFRRALDSRLTHLGELSPATIEAMFNLAQYVYAEERSTKGLAEATSLVDRAIDCRLRMVTTPDAVLFQMWAFATTLHASQSHFEVAESISTRIASSMQAAFEDVGL